MSAFVLTNRFLQIDSAESLGSRRTWSHLRSADFYGILDINIPSQNMTLQEEGGHYSCIRLSHRRAIDSRWTRVKRSGQLVQYSSRILCKDSRTPRSGPSIADHSRSDLWPSSLFFRDSFGILSGFSQDSFRGFYRVSIGILSGFLGYSKVSVGFTAMAAKQGILSVMTTPTTRSVSTIR